MKAIMTSMKTKISKADIFTILNLRTQWEAIVYQKNYSMPSCDSDVRSLENFVKDGHKSNRFKEGFSEAMSLAKKILESYENEKTNLSSLHRKALETL
jgi:hypothetical protein